MTRLTTILALCSGLVVACSGCEGPATQAPAPQVVIKRSSEPDYIHNHIHTRSEPGVSCFDACGSGKCASAYGVGQGRLVSCTDRVESLCICTAPGTDDP